MRLFHFSDDPAIEVFTPRPVGVPSPRAPGREWLNGPLVWAVEEARQALYLFPRECPRILVWPTPQTTTADLRHWWGLGATHAIAHIEWAWFHRVSRQSLHRYELPPGSFESLEDAGMWVARKTVTPSAMETITDLPAALAAQGVELRVVTSLKPLRSVWASSVHASGVRLRNARGWALEGKEEAQGRSDGLPSDG